MGEILSFKVKEGRVIFGIQKRSSLTKRGCNEPFKNHFWCPRKRWFMRSACVFVNQRECENYRRLCGGEL